MQQDINNENYVYILREFVHDLERRNRAMDKEIIEIKNQKISLTNELIIACELLKAIDVEFRTDPLSVQCFDLRLVEQVSKFVERFKNESK